MKMPSRSLRTPLSVVAAAALLAACSATPYQAPAVQLPGQWQHGKQQALAPASQGFSDRWWTAFGDTRLNGLIEDALRRNNNLAVAAWKVRNARLSAGNAAANLWPTPSGSVSATSSRGLDGNGSTSRSAGTTLGVSWEVDLWGKLAAQQRMADWEAIATEQDRQAAAQALVATVAKSYWQLAVLDRKITSQQASIDVAARTAKLVQVQYTAGAVSGLELAQARQSLASQQAALTTLQQQRTEQRNALSILFDAPPEALPPAAQRPSLPVLERMPQIPAGLPADLLARRPDLQAAELRLRSALANVDATRASYYPTLSLTGSLGTGSTALSSVLQNPVLTLGAGLALPFLRMGEMRRNTAIAQGSYEQAIVTFRQTLYAALADVENALSSRTQLAAQHQALAQSLQLARRAEQLTGVRYQAGSVALKIWLEAQETRRSAELALLDVELSRAVNLVTLYQALGGSPLLAPDSAESEAPAVTVVDPAL